MFARIMSLSSSDSDAIDFMELGILERRKRCGGGWCLVKSLCRLRAASLLAAPRERIPFIMHVG